MTVTGRTFGEEAAAAAETPGQDVVRPLDKPLKPTGGLVILHGNLAPDGCVVKVAGHERQTCTAARRASSTARRTPSTAVKQRKIKPATSS